MRGLSARIPLAVLIIVLCSLEQTGRAYTFRQAGVESNFLIDNGRVLFAQGDGSLTALSLENGDVLLRSTSRDYSGTLKRVPAGILVLAYSSITLLRADSLTPIWETKCSYDPNLTADTLVSYDGNGLVECRALSDGKVRWSYNLPGALQVVAESEKVLVHRAATFEDTPTTTVLLALDTGRELFRKTPPPGVHWNNVFFDGTNVYVQTGPFQGKRSDYRFEHLAVWNLRGEQTELLPLPSGAVRDWKFSDESFDLNGKTFIKGRIYANRRSLPPDRDGVPLGTTRLTIDDAEVKETEYDLGEGLRWVRRWTNSVVRGRESPVEFELRSAETSWKGTIPYLQGHGYMSAIAAAGGRILLGSNVGHVECLDARTGKSLWLYVFPTLRQTMSYSSPHGLPPMMADAAATFQRDNRLTPRRGFQVAGGEPSAPRVVRDPKPWDPFADLPVLLAVTWGGAAAVIAALFGLHLLQRIGRTSVQGLAVISALLTMLAFACFMHLGRVSMIGYIGLQVAVLAGVVFGLRDVVRCFRSRHWLCGAVLAPLFLVIAVLFLSIYVPILRF